MDPEANQKEQLELAESIIAQSERCDADGDLTRCQLETLQHDANRLAELVIALSEWKEKIQ